MRYIISALRETVSAQLSFACDSLRHAAVAMLSSEAIPLLKVRHLAGAGTSGKYTAIRRCIEDIRATLRGLPQRGALHVRRRLRWRLARGRFCVILCPKLVPSGALVLGPIALQAAHPLKRRR